METETSSSLPSLGAAATVVGVRVTCHAPGTEKRAPRDESSRDAEAVFEPPPPQPAAVSAAAPTTMVSSRFPREGRG